MDNKQIVRDSLEIGAATHVMEHYKCALKALDNLTDTQTLIAMVGTMALPDDDLMSEKYQAGYNQAIDEIIKELKNV